MANPEFFNKLTEEESEKAAGGLYIVEEEQPNGDRWTFVVCSKCGKRFDPADAKGAKMHEKHCNGQQ